LDCPSPAWAELVPMLNTIMAARSIVFMVISLWVWPDGWLRLASSVHESLVTKRPGENHVIITFSDERISAIDFGDLSRGDGNDIVLPVRASAQLDKPLTEVRDIVSPI
jgi:hypothetical protein